MPIAARSTDRSSARRLENPRPAELAQGASLGLRERDGREDGAGRFVFCARVGDHPLVQYRFVSIDGAEPVIVGDTLTALARARAEATTVRVLPDGMRRAAYGAWTVASRTSSSPGSAAKTRGTSNPRSRRRCATRPPSCAARRRRLA